MDFLLPGSRDASAWRDSDGETYQGVAFITEGDDPIVIEK